MTTVKFLKTLAITMLILLFSFLIILSFIYNFALGLGLAITCIFGYLIFDIVSDYV
jgi:hypothetical protein